MPDVKWIKIFTNMLNNKKIKSIRRMPEGNNIILIWVFLLTAAGESNKNGGLFLTDTIPFKEDDLATEFDFEIQVIRFALITLEKFGMIEIYDDVIYIKNWAEYQNIEGLEKVREQSRLRMQKHRENIKLLRNVTQPVTQSYAIELEQDKELDKEKELIPYAEIIACLNETCGTKFRLGDANRKHIHARWDEGYTLSDFETVISKKAAEWMGTERAQYLRPETLFGNKFDSYLNQVQAVIKPTVSDRDLKVQQDREKRQRMVAAINEARNGRQDDRKGTIQLPVGEGDNQY